jgi:hypothetical protein
MYDLIGDIHGYATPLKHLLTKLGYRESQGVWRHPERQVIFLGDFVDRGPEQLETVAIARAMVEAGQALAVMGNHEFNAVAWATPDPEHPGEHLRPHNEKHKNQHREFLGQVGENSQRHRDMIDWFRQLPLYLELDELRVIHACWHAPSLKMLEEFTDAQGRILSDAWPALCCKGTAPFEALETAIKGLEISLPDGDCFYDKDGNIRYEIRTRWWELERASYRDMAMVPAEQLEAISTKPIPEEVLPGYAGDKPLFVGHYWLTGEPAPLNRYIACLDYSIAAGHTKGGAAGKLCAYRFNGERELSRENFLWVRE